jgi:adenosylcobinamide-phosphate synthase
MSDGVIILIVAIIFDVVLGEPPNAVHPVVWMGRWIGWGERHTPQAKRLMVFIYGAGVVVLGMAVVVLLALGVEAALLGLPRVAGILVGGWLLKTTFALRGLVVAARAVQGALTTGNVAEARRLLAWHLVSRDTSALDEGLVAAATVESVAENFGDGVVAPLLAFALFGVPGALAYRFANTADAMLGYHDARREYLGKFAARLDDGLNFVPARLAAGLLLVGAGLSGADAAQGWRVMRREHGRTASPNAGWPMSAMAGALRVTLEKVGHYRLGDGATPNADTIAHSLGVMLAGASLDILLMTALVRVRPW